MKLLNVAAAALSMLALSFSLRAEDAAKPEAPKPDAAKPADAKPTDAPVTASSETPKPATETPKPATDTPAAKDNDSLIGDISKGPSEAGKGKEKGKKGKKAMDPNALTLSVASHDKPAKGEKKNKGQTFTLTASGDVLAKLNEFAEKHAHVKITGTLDGDKMTVKEVTEAPAEPVEKKKKNKNNA